MEEARYAVKNRALGLTLHCVQSEGKLESDISSRMTARPANRSTFFGLHSHVHAVFTQLVACVSLHYYRHATLPQSQCWFFALTPRIAARLPPTWTPCGGLRRLLPEVRPPPRPGSTWPEARHTSAPSILPRRNSCVVSQVETQSAKCLLLAGDIMQVSYEDK